MRRLDNSIEAFFELVRSGLWEKEARLVSLDKIDFKNIYRLAEEQSVLGLVAAGLEHIVDVKAPKDITLQIAGQALQLEQRNKAMNDFIADIIGKMRKAGIYTLLVKGQGIAQCYERPLWRTAGDIDFYLSEINYRNAKSFLTPLAKILEPEDQNRLHFGMTIDQWIVELHGTLHVGISKRMNEVSDEVHEDIFYNGNVRSWNNKGVQVFLPNADNDAIIIFNHFINHFYGEGLGLRQICDWCRLLWTYRKEINRQLLEKRLRKMSLMTEWRAFGAFAVEYLGMPPEEMPFYCDKSKYRTKASKIKRLIIETGAFGSNKDSCYRQNTTKWREYALTSYRRFGEFARIATIFPWNAPKFFVTYAFNRFRYILFC